ncbi:MAG: hypothetical protein WA708_14125 [Acidobacteriaceae bacterium]
MTQRRFSDCRALPVIWGLLIFVAASGCVLAEPTPAAVSAFDSYVQAVESRLAQQHRSKNAFLTPVVSTPQNEIRLRQGEMIVEQLTPSGGIALPGALLHHWRATGFAAGASAADFERLLKDSNAYPRVFSPEVLQAKVIAQHGDRLQTWMRIRQHHVITVAMDTTYDVIFGRLDAQQGYSISRSTRIAELNSGLHPVSSSREHGFLWRQNIYWSYEERDGGLYIQIESISLTRSIPAGLGWVVGPFVESVPRESLEFTLRSACNALGKSADEALNEGAKNNRGEGRTR